MKLLDYLNKHGNIEINEKELNEVLGIKEKPSKIYKPKENDKYWCLTIPEGVGFFNWSNHIFDFENLKYGNCFRNEDEAKACIEKLKIHRELELYADEHNEVEIDWNDYSQNKYHLIFEYCSKSVVCTVDSVIKNANTVYFTSEKIAFAAIQAIGEDRLKKYYFDIKE